MTLLRESQNFNKSEEEKTRNKIHTAIPIFIFRNT